LQNRIDKILALIETYCKKKLVFADPLLPFGTIREACPQIAHLFFANAKIQTQKNKRAISFHHTINMYF
jgi:hypothetical protein